MAISLFNPAMPAVGESFFGQCSVQLMCVWQEWQPASPATARSRSRDVALSLFALLIAWMGMRAALGVFA